MQDKLEEYRDYLIERIRYHKIHFEKYVVQNEECLAGTELQYIIDTENLLKRLNDYKV